MIDIVDYFIMKFETTSKLCLVRVGIKQRVFKNTGSNKMKTFVSIEHSYKCICNQLNKLIII